MMLRLAKDENRMNRDDLKELHYIAPLSNLALILQHGILSNANLKRMGIKAESVASEDVQKIRARKVVPNGRPLHEYANLYICARNPMMYKRRGAELVVVRVGPDVLNLPSVVIADGNAASGYTAFWSSPAGLQKINKDMVFARSWDSDDPIEKLKSKRVKCAEVLVPDKVETRFITGFYVPNIDVKNKVLAAVSGLAVDVDAHLFFRD